MEGKKKTTATKSIETAKLGYGFTKKMYSRALEAKETGAPVAWCMFTSWIADPLLLAMDVLPIYPENYGAAIAAKRANVTFLEACEADGFSPHICGYARTCLGYAHRMCEVMGKPPEAPLGGNGEADYAVRC